MNILYQTNDNYAPFCGVSMTSLFENNRDVSEINVYLLDDNISEENKRKFRLCAEKYKRNITFVQVQPIVDFLEQNNVPKFRNSYTTWLKLFCIEFLNIESGNLIYIDADTICKAGVEALADIDLKNNVCGMVEDFGAFDYKTMIGLKNQNYFYAGMMVFNISKWLSQKCKERIIDDIKSGSKYPLNEQDIMNVLFADSIMRLHPKYNYIYTYEETLGLESAKTVFNWPNYFYKDMLEAAKSPVICHCLQMYGKRPWNVGCKKSKHACWDDYLALSFWSDYTKIKANIPLYNRIQPFMFALLPRCIYEKFHRLAYLNGIKEIAEKWRT